MTLLTDPFPSIDDLDVPLVAGADLELMTQRRRAYDEGRAAGLESGRFEGFARGVAEGRTEVATRVDAALAALSTALDHDLEHETRLSTELLDLALAIASAVLQREVTLASDPGREALLRAMTAAPERTALIAHLNPEDRELLGDVGDVAPGRDVTIVADPSVGRGECVLDAGPTRVDARFGPALERVRAVLAPSPRDASDGPS
jgi:flagellar assembly protein FliH